MWKWYIIHEFIVLTAKIVYVFSPHSMLKGYFISFIKKPDCLNIKKKWSATDS